MASVGGDAADEWVRRQLARAPRLSDEQRAAIVVLLAPVCIDEKSAA